ncbi:MAG: hypothetical protein JW860_04685 [Sedimentisphaerales bacterium]|nr:hypothetical protein [Sedimentisphaerales bacterium]
MTKFFEIVETIINDELFIGESENDLNEEMKNNMWHIQITTEQQKLISEDILLESIENIIENRKNQIIFSNKNHGMLFYLWFDEQACQLRFNLISDFHNVLPFKCNYKIINNPLPVLKSFLYAPYHNGIPINIEKDDIKEQNKTDKNLEINIFCKHLP